MKKYVFEVTITEGSDEYWDELETKGISGADEILQSVKEELEQSRFGFDTEVKLVRYEDS